MPSGLFQTAGENASPQPPSAWANQTPGTRGYLPAVPLPYGFILEEIVQLLKGFLDLVSPGGLDAAVAKARASIGDYMDRIHITDAASFFYFASTLLRWTPTESFEGKDIVETIAMFYFIFNQPPLVNLQTAVSPDSVGKPLTWLSNWLVVYAKGMGQWMDTTASINDATLDTFKKSPIYKVNEEALVPDGGWKTFNEFFARKLKPGMRPVDSPNDDTVIVYPADCNYVPDTKDPESFQIKENGTTVIKNITWKVGSLLYDSPYANDFNGGVWMHAFLSAYNYHRQHAPVAGTVLEAKVITGTAYLETSVEGQPMRTIMGNSNGEPGAEDNAGYQFLQIRGLVIIDNPTVGKVAVLPVGMAQVSSVNLRVKKGDVLKKGDEISHFKFGGSDIICVFQKKAGLGVDDFVPSPTDDPLVPYSKVGSRLATAKPQ